MNIVVLYSAVHFLIKGEKALNENGCSVRLIPTPRELSSDCGMALEIDGDTVRPEEIETILKKNGLPDPEKICEM